MSVDSCVMPTDLLSRGCRSATLFGTTGEGPSVGAVERERVASALVAEGLPPERLVEGVIASSVEEAAESTRRALARGAKAVLLAPPFYFRDGPDEAVAAWFSGRVPPRRAGICATSCSTTSPA